MAINAPTETDEEIARRLQQEEFGSLLHSGNYLGFGRSSTSPNNNSSAPSQDISAPLLDDNNNELPNPLLNANGNDNNLADNDNLNPNVALNQNVGGNAARRARNNVIGHVRDADTDSPRILLLRITIALLEIIATATVLAIGWNEGDEPSCNYLKYWVLVYTARHFVIIPLRIHIRFRTNHQLQNNNNNEAQQAVAWKSIQLLRWLSIMTFLLFLLGQTFLFTQKGCQDVAPTVWYYCLVIIILVYVSLALPFLIVLAICICLPCVLIVFRFFAEPEGADDRIIKDLPTRKITAADLKKTSGTDGDNKDETTETNDSKQEVADDEEDEDAPSCAICMQVYKIDDELRILPCQHEFHIECVDKWLPMKKICPLCRHDITKKAQASQRNLRDAQENNSNDSNSRANGNENNNDNNDDNV